MEKVPLFERKLPSSTLAMIENSATEYPYRVALEFIASASEYQDVHQISYARLYADIVRAANMFRSLGIARRDVLAFLLPNLPQTHLCIWGGEAAGIVMPLNPMLEADRLAGLLNAAAAKWLVTLSPTVNPELWTKALAAASTVPSLCGIVTIDPRRANARNATDPGVTASKDAQGRSSIRIVEFEAELQHHLGTRLQFEAPVATDISSYFCTGGTTGIPKIATRTHASEVSNAWALASLSEPIFPDGMSIFCGLPLFHVNGQIITGLSPWIAGGRVVIGTPSGYRGEGVIANFFDIARHCGINAFSAVPTVLAALVQQPAERARVKGLRLAISGAAPLSAELLNRFVEKTGIRVLEGYGLTEGACISSSNPPAGPARPGSIGIRIPYQDMRAVVLDHEGSFVRDAGTDEVGAILIKGPNVFAGYVEPRHNDGIWVDRQNERWFNTGDLGREDAEGYFWLTGRRKELIIRGGHNLDPKSIEEPIQRHPAVSLAAAIGRPDIYAGELPVVYVELKKEASATSEELLEFAQRNISEQAAWPKEVCIVQSLPLTPVGKIFKPALHMIEIERTVRAAAERLAVQLHSVRVLQDSKRGLVAQIGAQVACRPKLADSLGQFVFEHEFVSLAEADGE